MQDILYWEDGKIKKDQSPGKGGAPLENK